MTSTASDTRSRRRSRLSGSGRDRGLLGARQDARATARHAAVVRPRRPHPLAGLHQGAGRVRLPDDGLLAGDQPLLLHGVPPHPGRGRAGGPDDPLPRQAGDKVPGVGKTWEEEWKPAVRARNEGERTADYSGLSDEELVAKLDELHGRMRHQWWIHGHINFVLLSSSAFCDLYDELMEPEESTESYQTLQGFHTRSVDVSRGSVELSRQAKASPALTELFRTLPTGGAPRRPRRDRGGPRLQGRPRRLPVRVRLAPRRRVRPGRRAVAGGPVHPAGQHRRPDRPRRRRGPRGPVPEERRHP